MNICGLCERELERGQLCPGDTLALAERLDRMPRVYTALQAFLAPAARGNTEPVARGHAGPSMPVTETVLDLRYGGMVCVLERWRSDVQAWRGWGQPAVEGGMERRLFVAARWLRMELEWISANYPSAGDLAGEVRTLERDALSIVGALPDRGRRIGLCVATIDQQGTVCGAPLRHQQGERSLVCPWCTTVYGSEDFLMLKHFQPESA